MKNAIFLSILFVLVLIVSNGCVSEPVDDPYGYNYKTNEETSYTELPSNKDDENKPPSTYVQVQSFQSADTFVLTNNKILKLVGISTPRPGEPYYKKSLEFTKFLVGLNFLRLVWVKGTKHSDRVWRANVIIKHSDKVLSMNEQLVKLGLAKVTATEPTKFQTLNLDKEGKLITLSEKNNKVIYNRLKEFELEAKKKKINLWSGKYEE